MMPTLSRLGPTLALACVVVMFSAATPAQTGVVGQWREYHNRKWNFCAAYPSGWKAVEFFDGDQLRTSPGDGDDAPTLILAAFRNAHTESEAYKPLEDVAEDYEDDLRDNMVKDLTSQNQSTKVAGLPALVTSRAFVLDGRRWRARELRIERSDHVVIEIFLRAPEAKFADMRKRYDEMIAQRLRAQCAAE